MLHILWLIIKWILILLGILIGLIFLILLLLLFCPIRYRGNLKKDRTDSLREIHAFGEVSWLLHIISAQVLGAGRSENKNMFVRDSFGKI